MIYENLIECLKAFTENKNVINYNFKQGSIRFINSPEDSTICIYSIQLLPEYRRCGIFSGFLNYLAKKYDTVHIVQPNHFLGCILLTTKIDKIYFVNRYNSEYLWSRIHSYDAQKSEEIAEMIMPLRKMMKENESEFIKLADSQPYRNIIL